MSHIMPVVWLIKYWCMNQLYIQLIDINEHNSSMCVIVSEVKYNQVIIM